MKINWHNKKALAIVALLAVVIAFLALITLNNKTNTVINTQNSAIQKPVLANVNNIPNNNVITPQTNVVLPSVPLININNNQNLSEPIAKTSYVAIIIDDMGVDVLRSNKVMALENKNLTLSFLPYASELMKQIETAKQKGFEIMMHLPMQPENTEIQLPQDCLKVGDSKTVIATKLEHNLANFPSVRATNNHMGSLFTENYADLKFVMEYLKERNILFVDSLTTNKSVAKQIAAELNLPYISRDIFIDHYEDAKSVAKSFVSLEKIAKQKGFAIAIGHPKDNTIAGLKLWLTTIKNKNIKVVSLENLITIINSNMLLTAK